MSELNDRRMRGQVILVEDNASDAQLASRSLKKQGVTDISWFRDGREASTFLLGFAENEAPLPLMVLLDLKLPLMNGFEVLTAIKSAPRVREIPVIVFSSSDERSDIRAAYRNGANSYVPKPVGFDEFNQALGAIVNYWMKINAYGDL